MLPKMAGMNIERKNNVNKSSVGSSLPPSGSGSVSLMQHGHMRRRHGDSSFGGSMHGNGMKLGIAGESLQIKLTGTSLMNRN